MARMSRELIPGDPSHGCVRLKDADILKLKKYVSFIGTAVWICFPSFVWPAEPLRLWR